MLVLVLCHFRVPVVNDLVVKPEINSEKWWATTHENRAAMPVVVWCCRFGVRDLVKCAIACRLTTTGRREKARQVWGGLCFVRPKISSYLITASSLKDSNTGQSEAAGCLR